MGRTRDHASGMGLLERMEARVWKNGKTITYRFHPVGKKPINLGTDRIAAIRAVLDLNGAKSEHDPKGTLAWVWDRFKESPRWKKYSDATKTDYSSAWKQICERLGHMHMEEITTAIVVQYIHVERADAPRRADIEKSLLSRLFGHGIKLGFCARNSTVDVEPHGSTPRTVSPKSEVLAKFLSWLTKQTPQRQIIGMGAEYASLAGNRKVEFLTLMWEQVHFDEQVIRIARAKQRGAKRGNIIEVISITPALDQLLKRLLSVQTSRGVSCAYVFPTRDNNAYSASGFKTLWQRSVLKAIEEKALTVGDRFTFHDLRAYYVTMHKNRHRHLPDIHANPAVTAATYDRTTEVPRNAL